MHRLTCILVFVVLNFVSSAAELTTYYAPAESLAGPELREALHEIIRDHAVVPYSSSTRLDTSDALKVLDEDPSNTNNVLVIYSERSDAKSTFGLATGWNREHLWPNSYGLDDRRPAFSDLHNLHAADANVNSARGNKLFDESLVTDPNYRAPGHVEAPATSTDTDSWEPPDAIKGDIARAGFYMDLRYEGSTNTEPDLKLTDEIAMISSSTNWMAKLTTLLKWHQQDPVSATEIARNEQIHSRYQTNRNPFIDRPEWVREVFWPRLAMARSNDVTTLSWSRRYVGYTLQQSTNFQTWTAVTWQATNEPVITARVTNTFQNTFFRLREAKVD